MMITIAMRKPEVVDIVSKDVYEVLTRWFVCDIVELQARKHSMS